MCANHFQVTCNANASIIYGEKEKVLSLCEQLIKLGIKPIALVFNTDEPETEHLGIPILTQEKLSNFSGKTGTVIIPAFSIYGKGLDSLRDLDHNLLKLAVRDIEYLSYLLMNSHVEVELPPQKADASGILIGTQLGFVLGGIESWIANLYLKLKERGITTKVLEPLQDCIYRYVGPEFYGINPKDVYRFGPFKSFADYVMKSIQDISTNPPKIYIDNGSYRVLAAFGVAKKVIKNDTKIISVLHGDSEVVYRRALLFDSIIDKYIAVSNTIKDDICKLLPERKNDVTVIRQIPKPCERIRDFNFPHSIKLCYASRLEPCRKRTMWLTEVMDVLLAENVDFYLSIAGEGECYDSLARYVSDRQINNRVSLMGMIPHTKMNSFWQQHEVFLNFSREEGGPLTLVESMSQGVVPIVTPVGNGKDFVNTGENGYLISSPLEASNAIMRLATNSTLLHNMRYSSWKSMLTRYHKTCEITANLIENMYCGKDLLP